MTPIDRKLYSLGGQTGHCWHVVGEPSRLSARLRVVTLGVHRYGGFAMHVSASLRPWAAPTHAASLGARSARRGAVDEAKAAGVQRAGVSSTSTAKPVDPSRANAPDRVGFIPTPAGMVNPNGGPVDPSAASSPDRVGFIPTPSALGDPRSNTGPVDPEDPGSVDRVGFIPTPAGMVDPNAPQPVKGDGNGPKPLPHPYAPSRSPAAGSRLSVLA